jgi:hypothetical protein
MDRRSIQHEQTSRQTSGEVYADLGFSRPPSVDGVMASYLTLPKNEITPLHHLHHTAMQHVLWNALATYSNDYQEVVSSSHISPRQLRLVKEDFHSTTQSAQKIDFPLPVLKPLGFGFIDLSLDQEKALRNEVRQAAAKMGLSVGNERLHDARVSHVLERLNEALQKDGKIPDDYGGSSASLAKRMLDELNVPVSFTESPSVIESATLYAKMHSRGLAIKAAAVAIAGTVFASPSIANASEPSPSTIQLSSGTDQPNTVSVKSTNENTETTPPVAVPLTNSLDASVATQTVKESTAPVDKVQTPAPSLGNAPTSVETYTVAPTKTAPVTATPPPTAEAIALTPDNQTVAPPTVEVTPVIAVAPEQASGDVETATPIITLAPEAPATPSTLNPETATPEQTMAQTIADTLNNDGDVTAAVSGLLKGFGKTDQTPGIDAEGNKIVVTTNNLLFENVKTIQTSYEALIQASGHADVKYVNTSLMAIAVLEAAAKDQTVLSSKEVQDLIAGVVVPTDPYQLRLYNQYVATAKAALETNDSGVLIAGFDVGTDPAVIDNKSKVEALYAYILMANTTDADQSSKIQAMKDADAKAAADKAAADAAAKAAQEQVGSNAQPVAAEAIANLISKETDPVKKTMFIALQFFMSNGYTAPQAAGIIGNLNRESGSSMDPGIHQKGGPAEGLAQWESGRLAALKAFAAIQGKPWDDLGTQLLFIVKEMNTTRHSAFGPVTSSQNINDAAYAFMRYFETPDVVIHGTKAAINAETILRAGRGQATLDAFNAEVKAVTDARAAAEAARLAKGMNLAEAKAFMARYKGDPSNKQYIGGSGTTCNGGPLSNCTSFSTFFVNKYTTLQGMGKGTLPGNGSTEVQTIVRRNPSIGSGHVPKVDAIFSTPSGQQYCGPVKCGHTGVILGVDADRGVVIVGEAGCSADGSWDTAREYPIGNFSSTAYTYAYTNNFLKIPVA